MSGKVTERDITKPLLWTLIGLIVAAIVALAAIPLMSTSGRDARRAEGEHLMGAARDACRTAYVKHGKVEDARAALRDQLQDFEGKYYSVAGELEILDQERARVKAMPHGADQPIGYMEFDWSTGESNIAWP